MTPDTARTYLEYNMQACLYRNFYCHGFPAVTADLPFVASSPRTTSFAKALSAANAGQGPWESGWTLERQDAKWLVVSRGGLRIWVYPSEATVVSPPRIPGESIRVHMPKELLRLSPGFYTALGNHEFPGGGTVQVVRFYWNLQPKAATKLIENLTTDLNDSRVPFRLKVIDTEQGYTRCDAAVLYVPTACYLPAATVVASTYSKLTPSIKALTPAFTRRLAPGLALAEDPGGGESFGMSRCRLLAEGVVRAHDLGQHSLAARMTVVEEQFCRAGISIEAPYLNAGSSDDYVFGLV